MAGKKKKERVVFLSGKKVNLRPLDKKTDLEKFLVWINDQEIIEFMSAIFPADRIREEKWFEKERQNEVVLAVETKRGRLIGDIGLHRIDFLNGTAHLGIMIGDKRCWSRGFGFDAEMTILNYGFNTLNLRKVMHCAFSANRKSVGCARKCGGVREGILRRHIFGNGQYYDLIEFAIFKKRWQKIWEEYGGC